MEKLRQKILKMIQFGAILSRKESRIYVQRDFYNNSSRNFSTIKILQALHMNFPYEKQSTYKQQAFVQKLSLQ